MKLTQKQENFIYHYLEHGNASEAYRHSYNAENMKPETINRKAKEVVDNGNVAARIAELREEAATKAELTLESHLFDLKELRNQSTDNNAWSAAIQAEIARGKAAGLYMKQVEVKGMSHEEALAQLD